VLEERGHVTRSLRDDGAWLFGRTS
jgi:hypothetical protein